MAASGVIWMVIPKLDFRRLVAEEDDDLFGNSEG